MKFCELLPGAFFRTSNAQVFVKRTPDSAVRIIDGFESAARVKVPASLPVTLMRALGRWSTTM